QDGLGVERSAYFARRRDLRRLAVPGPVNGRTVMGRVGGQLVATEPRTSICIVGPSQSFKTSGLCVPALLELGEGGGAAIVASVKGDIHSVTHRRRASLGKVKVFDPTCVVVTKSATWTPLRAAHTVTGAQSAARGLTDVAGSGGLENADFWMQSAKELLWPLLYVAARSNGTMRDVVRWVTTHDRPAVDKEGHIHSTGEVLGRLRQIEAEAEAGTKPPAGVDPDTGEVSRPDELGPPKAGPGTEDASPPVPRSGSSVAGPLDPGDVALAGNALAGIWASDERTRSSIYTTARTIIEAWSDPVVATAADGCEITPEWLLEGDNTLYIVAPAREQARLRPVFACMVADLVHEAFDVATRAGGELPTKLLVLLDEAANICPVRELPAWCSTCPSHGITLMTVWQDRSQQRLRYGREGAETVWNNSGAKVILSGLADQATAEVTSLLGEEEHQRMGSSVDLAGSRRSVSAQTGTRRLVSEDSLRRQKLGQGLLIYKDLPAMRLTLRPYYEDRKLKALQEAKPRRGTEATVRPEAEDHVDAEELDDVAGAA
ncbi:MAG TPA: type IV secretory system conjugative DNA transfer family protein, partial [Acidimicrobiales bacterium]|nr:type IV secretory system conjugative DNA transfer family protein [Acidimicrobiales bacterium]